MIPVATVRESVAVTVLPTPSVAAKEKVPVPVGVPPITKLPSVSVFGGIVRPPEEGPQAR